MKYVFVPLTLKEIEGSQENWIFEEAKRLLIEKENIDPSSMGVEPIVKEVPENGKIPKALIRESLPDFLTRIEIIQPKVLIVLGGPALSALLPEVKGGVNRNRLKTFEWGGYPLVATFHLSSILYNQNLRVELLDDLYSYIVEDLWAHQDSGTDYPVIVVESPAEAQTIFEYLATQDTLSFDLETTSLDYGATILTAGFHVPNSEEAYVFPIFHPEGKLNGQETLEKVKDLVLFQGKEIIGQNIKFDLGHLLYNHRPYKAPNCLTKDSGVYHYLLSEHSPTRNLNYLVQRYTTLGGYKQEVDTTNLVNTPLELVSKYNGKDCIAPVEVIRALKGELQEQQYYNPRIIGFYKRLSPFISCIESNGVKVDINKLLKTEKKFIKERDQLEEELKIEMPSVKNIRSSKQLSDYFFKELKLPIPDVKGSIGKSGMPSTSEKFLKYLDHPSVEKILEYRKLNKVLTSYIRGTRGSSILENLNPRGFVHPNYYITKEPEGGGTVTGRLSCKRPAMQTIPRESPIRNAFISRYGSKGLLLEIDASQMELRYGAMISGDKTLMKIFQDRLDPHQATADLCGVERQTGKNINFGIVYEITPKGLVEKMGISLEIAKDISVKLKEAWGTYYEFMDAVRREAILKGEVSTPYGRFRRVAGASPGTGKGRALLREAANFVIQAPASDIIQLLGWHLTQELKTFARPIGTNHDGLLWDLLDCHLDKVLDKVEAGVLYLPRLVEEVLGIPLTIPYAFTVKVGKNWGEMKQIEQEFYTEEK